MNEERNELNSPTGYATLSWYCGKDAADTSWSASHDLCHEEWDTTITKAQYENRRFQSKCPECGESHDKLNVVNIEVHNTRT